MCLIYILFFSHGKTLLFIWFNKNKISCIGTILKSWETATLFCGFGSWYSISLPPHPAFSVDRNNAFRSLLANTGVFEHFPTGSRLLIARHACGYNNNHHDAKCKRKIPRGKTEMKTNTKQTKTHFCLKVWGEVFIPHPVARGSQHPGRPQQALSLGWCLRPESHLPLHN